MSKKIIIIGAGILLGVGLFFGGMYTRTILDNREKQASVKPVETMVEAILENKEIEAQYEASSAVYKSAVSQDEFAASIEQLKGAIVESTDVYYGSSQNIIDYTLVKPDNSYAVSFSTSKEPSSGDRWVITSVNVTELQSL